MRLPLPQASAPGSLPEPSQDARGGGPAGVLDLLHPEPVARTDHAALVVAFGFGFASGVSGGTFVEALERAPVAPSTWEPDTFAKDLFLEDFVARCTRVRIGGHEATLSRSHLVRLLARPPSDPRVTEFRRRILRELAESPDLRAELEQVYVTLCRFRSALEGATAGKKWDQNRRQLDILSLAKELIDRMAGSFATATSGLGRLRAFGLRVRASEPFRSMADLLDYDEHLATLDLRVRVGADGRVRRFEVRSAREHEENPFVTSPLRRWLAKLELLVRGYRFGEGEIMARLLDAVFEGLEGELVQLVQLVGDIEFYLAALGFRDLAAAAGLSVCLPELDRAAPATESDEHGSESDRESDGESDRESDGRVLLGLFNPLLLGHGIRPVPCDLVADQVATTVMITGPNSGGKTRLLQSIGLCQLLAQAGAFVPARAARLRIVPGLVVSLVQEATADQSEGRLGMELLRIRALFERLRPGAMVILDELCSGTNPSEGEEIFELVVSALTKLRPQAFITTHFLSFAARLERERTFSDLRFIQVELGAESRPTYQFVPGVAKTSLAHQAAARLGVTREELLALVLRSTQREAEPREIVIDTTSSGASSAAELHPVE